ncbi:TniQ family protein [Roseateles amylovorans]|uniref:TniQ family protein n=1 Tax=Roseateles amylovorans TaxID=2978473 RepID=UPI00338F5277
MERSNGSGSTADSIRQLLRELGAVPKPAPFESPSSWLTRIALSQGVSVQALSRSLNLSSRVGDFDLHFAQSVGVAPKDSQTLRALPPSLAIFWALHEPRRKTSRHLLYPCASGERSRAVYRFCPQCLAQCSSRAFPAHWRFRVYRMCVHHRCLLEDRCQACSALVMLPVSPTIVSITSSYQTARVASLAYCRRCGASLLPHSGHSPNEPQKAECSDDTLQRWWDASTKIHRLLCTDSLPIDLELPYESPPIKEKSTRPKQPSRPSKSLLDSLPYPVRLPRRTV